MYVWLDDEYHNQKHWFPEEAIHCRWPEEVIKLLETGEVKKISLDHDLGECHATHTNPRTGMDVLKWLEEKVVTGEWKFNLPRIRIHSLNPVGASNMKAAANSIIRRYKS